MRGHWCTDRRYRNSIALRPCAFGSGPSGGVSPKVGPDQRAEDALPIARLRCDEAGGGLDCHGCTIEIATRDPVVGTSERLHCAKGQPSLRGVLTNPGLGAWGPARFAAFRLWCWWWFGTTLIAR